MTPSTMFLRSLCRAWLGAARGGRAFFLCASLAGPLAAGPAAAEPAGPAGPAAAAPPAGPRPPQVFSEASLRTLLTATLQRDYVKDQGELELIFQQPWAAPKLPDEPLTVKILELPGTGVTPGFIIRFQLCTAQATLGTWQLAMQAHVWREVWVAHSNLRRGEPVNGADLVRERFDVLKVHDALAEFSATDAKLELAEPVGAGVPLLARVIKPRTVIHRGQEANAVLQDGALSISTKVEALEDGRPAR